MLVSAKRVIAWMTNLGGTADCLCRAFRPIVDGRFFVFRQLAIDHGQITEV